MENTEEKFKSAINEIKQVAMTSEEKGRVLQNILNTEPEVAQESYFIFRSFYYTKSPKHFAYVSALAIMFVFLFGGSVMASTGSLPGSVFYPLKVGLVEPVRSLLTFSPEAEARFQSELAVRRLTEAESLADKNELSEEREEKLNELLEKHTEQVSKSITKLHATTPEAESEEEDIITNFETRVNAHAEALDVFEARNKKPEDFTTLMRASEKVKISENARAKAIGLREMFKPEVVEEGEESAGGETEGEVKGASKEKTNEQLKEEKETEIQGNLETEVEVEAKEEEAEPILQNTENKVRNLLPL